MAGPANKSPGELVAGGTAPGGAASLDDPKVKVFVAAARLVIDRAGGLQPALVELRRLAASMGLDADQCRAVESALSPPLISPPKTAAAVARPASVPATDPSDEIHWIDDDAPDSPPPIVQPLAVAPAEAGDRIAWFRERALAIVAENRGFGPRSLLMLAQAASDFGLTPVEREEAMRSLRQPLPAEPIMATPAEMTFLGASTNSVAAVVPPAKAPCLASTYAPTMNAPTTGAPASALPAPAAPAIRPSVAFRAAAMAVLVKMTSGRLSRKERRAVINRGVAEFRLSEPFSRRIVDEVAAECGLAVESRKDAGQPAENGDRVSGATASGVSGARASGDELPAQTEAAQAFMDRARQILAEHRGLNAKSRVFLNAAAVKLGLPTDEVEPLIAQLLKSRQSKNEIDPLEQEHLDAFRQWLDVRLSRLDPKIVTASVQRRFLTAAEEQHGISPDKAKAILAELSAGRDLRFISAEQATRHIRDRVDEVMLGAAGYDASARYRLIAEAEQWGLEGEDAESLIDEQVDRFKGDTRRRAKLNRRLIAAALGIVAIVAAGLCVAIVASQGNPTAKLDSINSAGDGGGAVDGGPSRRTAGDGTTAEGSSKKEKGWWGDQDIDLIVAMTGAKSVAAEFEPLLVKTRAGSADERSATYRALVQQAADAMVAGGPVSTARVEAQRSVLEEIISGCYALDPDDGCAAVIAEELTAKIPSSSAPLPADAAAIRQAFWACATSAAALKRPGLSAGRADALSRQLSRALGLSIDPALGPIELTLFMQEAIAGVLYRKLAAEYSAQPEAVKRLEPALAAEAAIRLDDEALPRLQADYLAAVVPSLGADWKEFQEPLRRCVDSGDPLVVLKIVDACERATNTELQEWLIGGLLTRVRHYGPVASATDALAAVREALGASGRTSPLAEADRYLAFSTSAEKALAVKAEKADRQPSQLARAVELAHLNSLGCALARQDAGRATFDELLRTGPPKLKSAPASLASGKTKEKRAAKPPKEDPRAAEAGLTGRLRDLGLGAPIGMTPVGEDVADGDVDEESADAESPDEPADDSPDSGPAPLTPRARPEAKVNPTMRRYYLQELRQAIDSNRLPADRVAVLKRTLPTVSRQLDDLDKSSAEAVANYLCTRKSDVEHKAVLDVIDSFARWKSVRLVIADHIDLVKMPDDQLLPILSGLTGREIEPGASARKQAREALLQSVIDDLSGASATAGSGVGGGAAPAFEEAREALLSLYVEQAKVSGVASSDYLAVTKPSQIMKLLILQQAGATVDPTRPADAALLARLPQETDVVDYLADDDLSRTVLLQRLWLRVCVACLAGQRAEMAAEGDAVVAALAASDRSSSSLAAQLMEGETALLKVWLLWNRPKA